jgi:hypothetical protein
VTLVILLKEKQTHICVWKEQDPHCHVDPVTRLVLQTLYAR